MSVYTRAGSTLLLASPLNEFNRLYRPETARAGQCTTCNSYIETRFRHWLGQQA